jgi:hypothetical protein
MTRNRNGACSKCSNRKAISSQSITLLADGGDTRRNLQLYLNLHAEHLLDCFHMAMRLTALQTAGIARQAR